MNRFGFILEKPLPRKDRGDFMVGDRVKYNFQREPDPNIRFGDIFAAKHNSRRGEIVYIQNGECLVKWDGFLWTTRRCSLSVLDHE